MEKYVSFSLGSRRFLDSCQFLSSSLSTLVEDLANENPSHFESFLSKEFPFAEERALLLRKGVYPYTWMDCIEKFDTTCLPPKEAFYNDLLKCHISDEEYNHAKMIWNCFKLQNMGQYHDLYLKSDVLQLACVYEKFRDECTSNYGLDPAHFYTSPGLAWSAALKISKCRLELITEDILDAYLMIELGLRGGISQISNRFATANTKYIPETYDSTKDMSYLMYVDNNNLYGASMCLPLPTGGFKFLNEEERNQFNLMQVQPNSNKGYILQVDLEYPEHLHDLHSDYPLAPEIKQISDEMLSPHSRQLFYRDLRTTLEFLSYF